VWHRFRQVVPGSTRALLHLESGCYHHWLALLKCSPTVDSHLLHEVELAEQNSGTNQTKPAGDLLERFCKTRYLNHHTNLTGYALENVSYRGCILLPEWASREAADSAIWDCLKTCQLGRYMSWNGAKYKVDPSHYSPKSEPPPPPRLSKLEWTSSYQSTGWGWGFSSCSGDEPKTYPPLPKVFGFFSLFFAPKFFPPTYLTSFCIHSIVKAWESLKWEGRIGSLKWEGRNGSQNNALEVGG
jgi:hypothetical protein